MDFRESEERRALRDAVAELGARYGRDYYLERARSGGRTAELWAEAGRLGYLGINIPEEYGGGGGGIAELALVLEELGAAGCPLLMMVVSPAICATVVTRFGTEEQKKRWLPGVADGSVTMAFAITEPDAGSNSHNLTTVGRRDGDDWVLRGRKVFITGVDGADAVLVVGRTEDARTGRLRPALFIVPTDAPGFSWQQIEMELVSTERQFSLVFDDVRLPSDALVGGAASGAASGAGSGGASGGRMLPLFAGLNPERIMTAAFALGVARLALGKAVDYAKTREVWGTPIGAHQALAHPLADAKVDVELARLMTQKAAFLYDVGDDMAAGEAANIAKYAAGEACAKAVDVAIQVHGGYGLAAEYGLATLLAVSRVTRIAPVSREMILNFVAQHSLGLPKSY
jgi:hypothetical protein